MTTETTTETTEAPTSPKRADINLNPIIVRDLRTRMRGTRAFIVITAYLSMLSCLVMILYLTVYTSSPITSYSGSPIGPVMGKTIFGGLILLELALVCFIAPAFTAGSISGERERQTYDLLRTTLLRAHSLVLGKLSSALAYVILLIIAAIPLQSLAFMFGGVSLSELVIASVALFVTAVAFGSTGIFFSSLTHSTLVSTVMTYATVLLILFGIPMLEIFSLILFGTIIEDPFSVDSYILQLLIIYAFGFLACTNPIVTAVITKLLIEEGKSLFIFTENIDGHTVLLVNPWLIYVLLYAILSLVLIIFTIVKVRMRDTK